MTRRGSVAFHYGRTLTRAQLEWFGRFDVLVTHDPLPPSQVKALRDGGTRLALYEWTVAFYRTLVRRDSWNERLLRDRGAALLNRNGLRGHAGASDADAFYYDPAHPDHAVKRVAAIAARLKEIGYDGVFFDTTTFESVHPDALAEYRRRHPDVSYDAAFARFLAALRKELAVIVTNQGYRAPEHYLPHADYDVTESLLTRPWHDASNRWNSVDFLMPELILKEARRYPHVRFVHLNYLERADPQKIESILATARLFGQEAFVALPDVFRTAFSELYFVDLGRPTGDIRRDGLTATRPFECGEIVVTPERAKIVRALP
ncbi:MAG TPA: hypothetical protein VGF28_26285 [Thermoanaerobaculia bacterium]|jgi:hypothetical protein